MIESQTSFLNISSEIMGDDIWRAVMKGKLHAGPMVMELNYVHAVSRGMREIFKMVRNNDIQKASEPREDGSDAPLDPNTIDSLLAMGEAVAHRMACDIEKIARQFSDDLEASHG